MLLRKKYGRIGWFALPTFWLFEYLGPLVELAGYALILFLVLMEHLLGHQFIKYEYLWAFLLASLGLRRSWSTSSRSWWAPGGSGSGSPTGCSAGFCRSAAAVTC